MNHEQYDDSYIRGILNTVKTIAMVGISPKDNRPSYFAFMMICSSAGYRMVLVNPGRAGKEISRTVRPMQALADISQPIDMVDIFRGSPFVMGSCRSALL